VGPGGREPRQCEARRGPRQGSGPGTEGPTPWGARRSAAAGSIAVTRYNMNTYRPWQDHVLVAMVPGSGGSYVSTNCWTALAEPRPSRHLVRAGASPRRGIRPLRTGNARNACLPRVWGAAAGRRAGAGGIALQPLLGLGAQRPQPVRQFADFVSPGELAELCFGDSRLFVEPPQATWPHAAAVGGFHASVHADLRAATER